jgi:hypothetical protein
VQYSGWEESQAIIQRALEEHAPIDGLLGFSQGATATALFLSHALPAGLAPQLRFAIIIAGAVLMRSVHAMIVSPPAAFLITYVGPASAAGLWFRHLARILAVELVQDPGPTENHVVCVLLQASCH